MFSPHETTGSRAKPALSSISTLWMCSCIKKVTPEFNGGLLPDMYLLFDSSFVLGEMVISFMFVGAFLLGRTHVTSMHGIQF